MSSTKVKTIVDFEAMGLQEVDSLIRSALAYKRAKQTNPVLIKGHLDSVRKHKNGMLIAIRKLQLADGVPTKIWADVEQEISSLSLSMYKETAESVKLPPARQGKH